MEKKGTELKRKRERGGERKREIGGKKEAEREW